ncbi:hypothetical protein CEXT_543761 [Caerostris extrusa]|uniref:Uncharacterized protein n=1 Tax=Caerostris extrusa TaxID=172846 RepID=A0AAV4SMB3_CAEEX|nr:hypothetical protein CEXT_543761 [Caerostris extrusa]
MVTTPSEVGASAVLRGAASQATKDTAPVAGTADLPGLKPSAVACHEQVQSPLKGSGHSCFTQTARFVSSFAIWNNFPIGRQKIAGAVLRKNYAHSSFGTDLPPWLMISQKSRLWSKWPETELKSSIVNTESCATNIITSMEYASCSLINLIECQFFLLKIDTFFQ